MPRPFRIYRERYPASLIAAKHTLDQIAQRAPEILATRQTVFIDEKDIVFEASVQMRLESEVNYNGIVVAIDMCVHTIEPLEELLEQTDERLRERNACQNRLISKSPETGTIKGVVRPTDPTGKHLLVVHVALDPCHQMFDILRS